MNATMTRNRTRLVYRLARAVLGVMFFAAVMGLAALLYYMSQQSSDLRESQLESIALQEEVAELEARLANEERANDELRQRRDEQVESLRTQLEEATAPAENDWPAQLSEQGVDELLLAPSTLAAAEVLADPDPDDEIHPYDSTLCLGGADECAPADRLRLTLGVIPRSSDQPSLYVLRYSEATNCGLGLPGEWVVGLPTPDGSITGFIGNDPSFAPTLSNLELAAHASLTLDTQFTYRSGEFLVIATAARVGSDPVPIQLEGLVAQVGLPPCASG